MSIKTFPHVRSTLFCKMKQFCKISRALKFQIAKTARACSIFGQIKRIAYVSFSYFTLNKNST